MGLPYEPRIMEPNGPITSDSRDSTGHMQIGVNPERIEAIHLSHSRDLLRVVALPG